MADRLRQAFDQARRVIIRRVHLRSWALLSHILLSWDTYDNPVFLREAEHRPMWQGSTQWTTLSINARRALLSVLVVGWILVVLYVNNLLVFLVPPLVFMALATAVTLAPIVVQERRSHSWETLLTTPYSLDSILLSKTAGALTVLERPRTLLGITLGVVAVGVAMLSLVLVPASQLEGSGLELALCGTLLVIPLAGGALFLADRMQQYGLMVVAALAASASSASLRNAFPTAAGAVLLVWLGEVLAGAAAVGLYSGHAVLLDPARMIALVTLGPTVIFITQFDLAGVALFGLGTLLVREALIVGLWRWAVRRAQPHTS